MANELEKITATKPLMARAYGSIPHLPISKMGQGDKRIHIGQAIICLEKTRDKHDLIIVQEKVDGSCVAVHRTEDSIIPITRAGYRATDSFYEQHKLFHNWVMENSTRFMQLLQPGERLVGEWLAKAHGTIYKLPHEPFVGFDIMQGVQRINFSTFMRRCQGVVITPAVLHIGAPLPLHRLAEMLEHSRHGAELMEGAMYRVERNNEVDFLAKFVRPDFPCGKYLEGVTGHQDVWNWRPSGS